MYYIINPGLQTISDFASPHSVIFYAFSLKYILICFLSIFFRNLKAKSLKSFRNSYRTSTPHFSKKIHQNSSDVAKIYCKMPVYVISANGNVLENDPRSMKNPMQSRSPTKSNRCP